MQGSRECLRGIHDVLIPPASASNIGCLQLNAPAEELAKGPQSPENCFVTLQPSALPFIDVHQDNIVCVNGICTEPCTLSVQSGHI